MDEVMSSPEESGRRVVVLRRPDGLYTWRIEPSPLEHGGLFDTAEHAMAEGLASPSWRDPYAGMTVNERLDAAGLSDALEAAIREQDRETAIRLLIETNLPREAAEATVAGMLKGT